jgi:hypothetical protein
MINFFLVGCLPEDHNSVLNSIHLSQSSIILDQTQKGGGWRVRRRGNLWTIN